MEECRKELRNVGRDPQNLVLYLAQVRGDKTVNKKVAHTMVVTRQKCATRKRQYYIHIHPTHTSMLGCLLILELGL